MYLRQINKTLRLICLTLLAALTTSVLAGCTEPDVPGQTDDPDTEQNSGTQPGSVQTEEPNTELPEPPDDIKGDENSALPAVYIETQGHVDIVSKEYYVACTVSIDARGSGFESLPVQTAQIKGRGHTSWTKDKKPYKIKFDSKVSVLGLAEARQWVLIANIADKTLMRNYVAHRMGKVLQNLAYHPTQYLVEVYLNGSYRGVYTMGEQLQVGEDRIDIDESYPDVNTGYLLEIGGTDTDVDVEGEDYFSAGCAKWVRIKSPDTDVMSKAQFDYIKNYFVQTDKAIRSLDGYEKYIDVMSFIDWSILHELTYNLDSCYRRSCYFVKDKDGLLKMGPAWDFDLALGNFFEDNPNYDDFATVGPDTEDIMDAQTLKNLDISDYTYDDYYVIITWFNYLMADEDFRALYKQRWNEIKQDLYNEALKAVDEGQALLAEGAWERNFSIWQVDKQLGSEPKFTLQYKTLQSNVDWLLRFLELRYSWLDENINAL